MQKQFLVIRAGEQLRIAQQLHPFRRNPHWFSQHQGAKSVRCCNDWHEREKGIVDEGAGIDRDLVEAKQKRDEGRHDRVKSEKRREGDENAYRKSKRRPLRWIIDREQTAESGTEHEVSFESGVAELQAGATQTRNSNSFEATQRFGLVVESVKHCQQFCDHEQALNLVSQIQ